MRIRLRHAGRGLDQGELEQLGDLGFVAEGMEVITV